MSFSLLAVSEHSTHIMSDISVAFLPRKVNGCFGFSWIIPGFGNGYRTLARPRAVFIDFAVAGDSDHMPSTGQKLELHL